MASIPVTVTREAFTPAAAGRVLLVNIPRGQQFIVQSLEVLGLLDAAGVPAKLGFYKIDATRNGSGGTPGTSGILVARNDLAARITPASDLPAGISGSWAFNDGAYSTPPTIDAADKLLELSSQPYAGHDSWPPPGYPLVFHNLQAGDMQLLVAGLTGTGTGASGFMMRMLALAGA